MLTCLTVCAALAAVEPPPGPAIPPKELLGVWVVDADRFFAGMRREPPPSKLEDLTPSEFAAMWFASTGAVIFETPNAATIIDTGRAELAVRWEPGPGNSWKGAVDQVVSESRASLAHWSFSITFVDKDNIDLSTNFGGNDIVIPVERLWGPLKAEDAMRLELPEWARGAWEVNIDASRAAPWWEPLPQFIKADIERKHAETSLRQVSFDDGFVQVTTVALEGQPGAALLEMEGSHSLVRVWRDGDVVWVRRGMHRRGYVQIAPPTATPPK